MTRKSELQSAKRNHDKFLLKMGVHPEQLKEKKKLRRKERFDYSLGGEKMTGDLSTFGNCAKKEPNVYKGVEIIGVATMHKSNMVPVSSKEAAIDISKMRRG